MLYALHFGLHKQKRFIRYVKKEKEDEKLDFLKQNLQEYYDWSDKELKQNWFVVEMFLKDKKYVEDLDKMFGFNEKECKILGIVYDKPKMKKLEVETTHKIDEWF